MSETIETEDDRFISSKMMDALMSMAFGLQKG
jgi:hypothetical protein